jgi:hypothetical protein
VTKVPRLTPYVGVFYTRTFVGNDLDDLSSAGGRAGIYKGQGRVSAGVGVVWEHYLNFDSGKYSGGEADTVYPEVFVGTSF